MRNSADFNRALRRVETPSTQPLLVGRQGRGTTIFFFTVPALVAPFLPSCGSHALLPDRRRPPQPRSPLSPSAGPTAACSLGVGTAISTAPAAAAAAPPPPTRTAGSAINSSEVGEMSAGFRLVDKNMVRKSSDLSTQQQQYRYSSNKLHHVARVSCTSWRCSSLNTSSTVSIH